jgi:hypothetical protein
VGFERHADDGDEDFQEARGELQTLRATWRELHQFIKPSADADTLNQPTALIAAMVGRLRQLRGFESTDFTIFHTDAFEYLQVDPSSIREVLAELARVVDVQPFPESLGLIGIPNSQGNSLFINCLLAHEIGEYVYAERKIEPKLGAEIKEALRSRVGKAFIDSDRKAQSRMTQVVLKWAKELFCDLFAVRVVGPCYSFAYIELFDLINLLNKTGTALVAESEGQPQLRFYSWHPSHPFRVKAQAELLKAEGWWDVLKDVDSRHRDVMRLLLEMDMEKFIEAEETAETRAPQIRALWDIIPEINRELGVATDGLDPELREYGQLSRCIAEYLQSGIVPSTLNVEVAPGSYVEVHPTPMTLLNASFRYYLEGIEELMSKIKDQDPAVMKHRTFWMRRIESWTSKALEDISLIPEI